MGGASSSPTCAVDFERNDRELGLGDVSSKSCMIKGKIHYFGVPNVEPPNLLVGGENETRRVGLFKVDMNGTECECCHLRRAFCGERPL